MKKKVIIVSLVLIIIIIYLIIFIKPRSIKVIDSLGKVHIVQQGRKIDGVKIVEIKETSVIVEHIGQKEECIYYKEYKFWPDSQGGKILWEAPQAVLIFEKY